MSVTKTPPTDVTARGGPGAAACPLIGQVLLRTTSLSDSDLAEALLLQEQTPDKNRIV